ncbi:GTP cyclohydrolase II RibA [Trinickia sp. NRRL B-1857]|uniref:GTP cyclohydrolase II RibA n=1 Tax=Trinickia sp. NRRL B-1857 TaxID=3162879 RepID=UPI003D2BEFFF
MLAHNGTSSSKRIGVRFRGSTSGYLLYLRQEGRGIGLYQKLAAYRLQDEGYDTFEANRRLGFRDDERDFGIAAAMLEALSVSRIRLLSNNPDKQAQLEAAGIAVEERIPTGVFIAEHNRPYLEAKVRVARHTMDIGNTEVIS